MTSEKIIEKFYTTLNARNWQEFVETLHENVEYRVPQTREIVRGPEAVLDFMRTFPGDWTLRLLRVVANEKTGAAEVRLFLNNTESVNLAFFEIESGLVKRLDDYWPEPYEPPARVCKFIERY